jgi:hypothetical protein
MPNLSSSPWIDLGSSPERVLKTHFSNQVAHLFADPRSATGCTGLPSPISGKTHLMPTHDSLGLDYGYVVKNALRVTTIDFRRWRPIWFSAT